MFRIFYPASACFLTALVCGVFSSIIVDEPLEVPSGPRTKVCYGTHIGLSISGSEQVRYTRMRERYSECTHLFGNLEITFLDNPRVRRDLSFLRTIRYISGYVLIAANLEVTTVPLTSLEVIRGNTTYSFGASPDQFGLAVLLNDFTELEMPALKEITRGSVVFRGNPSLGFVDTIDWGLIARHRPNAVRFDFQAFNATVSNTNDRSACPSGRMWTRYACQADVPDIACNQTTCDGRCFGPGSDQCCHASCAVGCSGPTDGECIRCKDYEYDSQCAGFCPARTYPIGQTCIPIPPTYGIFMF